MKIVVLDGKVENPGDISWGRLEALGDLTVYDRTPDELIVERMQGAEIIITNKTPITADTISRCPDIRYIGVLATGYNIIDVQAAKERGIPVVNVPGYSTPSVTQFVFALLLEASVRVGHHSRTVHDGRWGREDWCYWDFPLIELEGKTFGIVGYGNIGRSVAKIARAFGMDVVVCSRSCRPGEGDGVARFIERDELLKTCDIVSLHCPLFPETQEMINKNTLAAMKNGAILINTARGALIVEEDVASALKSGKLRAYAADVAVKEPLPDSSHLLGLPGAILTPHIAWAAKECRERLMNMTADNLEAFLAGSPINVVNP